MQVTRIREESRSTRPYSETVWEAIGDRIDAALEAADVRLTMGGEPTFVSINDNEIRTNRV